jgi:hypothetical protein
MARWKIPNMLKHNFIRHFLYKAPAMHCRIISHTAKPQSVIRAKKKKGESGRKEI